MSIIHSVFIYIFIDILPYLRRTCSYLNWLMVPCFQDLVGKLKDAAKSVEKASQMWCRCPVSSPFQALNFSSGIARLFIPSFVPDVYINMRQLSFQRVWIKTEKSDPPCALNNFILIVL